MKRIFMLIATLFILSATTIIVLASGAFNGEGEPPETTFVRTTPTPATSDTPTATYIPLRELVPEEPETPEETETENPKYRDDIVSEGRLLAYDLQEIMQDYCEQYGFPYALGIAMAEIETHFDADAVSSTSDYGLMQINKCNHDWLLKEGFDVTTYDGNIGAGIYMIGGYIETYGDIGLALMAYNCGPSGAQKLWSQGVYSTDYTRKVMDAYNRWSEVLEVSP